MRESLKIQRAKKGVERRETRVKSREASVSGKNTEGQAKGIRSVQQIARWGSGECSDDDRNGKDAINTKAPHERTTRTRKQPSATALTNEIPRC